MRTRSERALMIQGGSDYCDEPASSQGQDRYFTGGYRRIVIDGAGHFPHREAPAEVAAALLQHPSPERASSGRARYPRP